MFYLIRKKGKLRVERDLHLCCLFELDTWRQLLKRVGFRVREKKTAVTPKNLPVFSCVR